MLSPLPDTEVDLVLGSNYVTRAAIEINHSLSKAMCEGIV